MRRDRWYLFLAIGIVIIFIILNSFSGLWTRKIFVREDSPRTERERLRTENEKLKADIALLEQVRNYMPRGSQNSIPAFVYSKYPFNLKNEILISIGEEQGVKVGQTVVFQGLFLGKVINVFDSSAVVQTIFDSRFALAAKVGEGAIDALLKGGDEPKLTLVVKNAQIKEGESIYSAAPGVPYGLPIGHVREYRMKEGDPFGEVLLRLNYSPAEINIVEVLK